jgi:hypothetical protein
MDDGVRRIWLDDVPLRRVAFDKLECLTCGATWHPRLHGNGEPYRQDLRCKECESRAASGKATTRDQKK